MLDVRRMQVLHAVVAESSITAAARRLGYTPSAISQQIATLEREAGLPLLERTARGVRPTEAGRVLTAYAADIGARVDAAVTAMADLCAGRSGRVAVRYFASVGAALVAPAVAALHRDHPGIRVDLRLTDPDDPLPEVREGRADLALIIRTGASPTIDGVRLIYLRPDSYRVVLPEGHPLAAHTDLELADLAEEPWIGSAWPGPCMDAIFAVCDTAGFTPRFAVQAEDYVTAQAFVAAGLGISLIPGMGLGDHPQPGVVVRDLRNPEAVRGVYAAVRTSAEPHHPALTAMLNALGAVASPLVTRRRPAAPAARPSTPAPRQPGSPPTARRRTPRPTE
ncbi:LysR family transcriptional regulator [Embleya sp. AB8]|uniref:LysR family transcriptional regulator n=1 Tax=Embleya sp. AB8 TaxID=3156304 RepID=UPI003C776A4C